MSEDGEPRSGLWGSLRRILDTALATVQNRVELFAVELREERCRLIEAMLCAVAVAAFGMMTLALLTFTVVILFWENGRLAALGGLSVVYLAGTVVAWRALQIRLKADGAFSGTLDQIRKDRSAP